MKFFQGFILGACLSLLLFCVSSWAGERVVLLSSFGSRAKEIRLEKKLEKIFRRRLSGNYDLVMIRNSDQAVLYRELQNPDNVAVFWVSHAAFRQLKYRKGTQAELLSPQQLILDYRGDNVAPVFDSAHPALRFLAVIGCHSDKILDELKTPNYLAHGKVRGPVGLKSALTRFDWLEKNRTFNSEVTNLEPKSITEISVNRWIDQDASINYLRSLRVVQGQRVLGVIEPPRPGEAKESIILSEHFDPALPIEVHTGQNVGTADRKIIFGQITIKVGQKLYRPFSDQQGRPFGKNRRVFLP